MDAVDKENRDPSQPTGATATIVRQEPMQQQQGVLEECAEYMTITEADGVAFKDSTLKDELEQVSSPLVDKQSRKQYHLPALVNQTYGIVVSLIKKEHNVKKAIVRCINMTGIQSCLDTERLLAALVTLIKIVDTNAFLLNPDNSARVTEQNFITQVWASILKSLSDIHGVLRMKIGEPSPAQGIGCRKRSYSDARVVKISARIDKFRVDSRWACGCCLIRAKMNTNCLLSKLQRRMTFANLCAWPSKDSLDAILQHILKRHMKIPVLSWYMHTNGVSAHTGTVHTAKAGIA
ncbi:hypothetical protein MUCCIDRAFT_114383 [Mucor lusitanicus CBS 277.49]|uniref:Uncharacterized protein n=1 Tax=Mucor lusitanicus CBS 277.49 TaxID=747725 RepID=A0A168HUH1_MUCCL|nr:hypothetical protein MUCCIDRAFT_114383 [Mucor lusitanicus CBS 277.49]